MCRGGGWGPVQRQGTFMHRGATSQVCVRTSLHCLAGWPAAAEKSWALEGKLPNRMLAAAASRAVALFASSVALLDTAREPPSSSADDAVPDDDWLLVLFVTSHSNVCWDPAPPPCARPCPSAACVSARRVEQQEFWPPARASPTVSPSIQQCNRLSAYLLAVRVGSPHSAAQASAHFLRLTPLSWCRSLSYPQFRAERCVLPSCLLSSMRKG